MDSVWKKSYLEQGKSVILLDQMCLPQHCSPQKVAGRVGGVDCPEIVDEKLQGGSRRSERVRMLDADRLTLKTLRRRTRKLALHRALKPTATMTHAPKPRMETSTRAIDQLPWMMNPIKRKIKSTRPASW